MILSVVAYGNSILKKKAKDITENNEDLQELIKNMWETMYNAEGVGLAAPQIGKSIRLFLVDTAQSLDKEDGPNGIKKVFINAMMMSEEGEWRPYEEGCLSIPHLRGDVDRQETIRIRYQDENFDIHEETFDGLNARVIQHEYDHIEGILFIDKIKPLKRRLLSRKLESIKKGKVAVPYKMKFIS